MTFDDGPDPTWTPRLLDVLADGGAAATFFVIAGRAAACPELIDRARREGHTIQLHCDRHIRHSRSTPPSVARDTRRALETLTELGVSPTLWRTPWGVIEPWTRRIAHRHGLGLVRWDVDTHDWRGDRASEILAATRDQLRDGCVVLAHDGIGPGARRDDVAETIAYTRLLIAEAAARDLQLVPLR
jgi:peptidoglycan/xylan/chitin deacetylase (PgdA/CDA1 family)